MLRGHHEIGGGAYRGVYDGFDAVRRTFDVPFGECGAPWGRREHGTRPKLVDTEVLVFPSVSVETTSSHGDQDRRDRLADNFSGKPISAYTLNTYRSTRLSKRWFKQERYQSNLVSRWRVESKHCLSKFAN